MTTTEAAAIQGENEMTGTTNPNHPKDCTLCGVLSGNHVYVDPATQARRSAAAERFNAVVRKAKR